MAPPDANDTSTHHELVRARRCHFVGVGVEVGAGLARGCHMRAAARAAWVWPVGRAARRLCTACRRSVFAGAAARQATSPEKRRICTKSLLTCAGSFRRWAAARGLAIVLWQERFRRTDQAPTTGILGCRQRSGEKKFDSHTITRRVSHGFKSRGCIPFGP